MTKIYVVTRGYYSDRRIMAAFSSKEKAQGFIDECRELGKSVAESATIEEYDLDVEVPPDAHHQRIRVELGQNGDTLLVEDEKLRPYGYPPIWIDAWWWLRTPTMVSFRGCVWARDADHAIKMARDARAASIAAGDLAAVLAEASGYASLRASL